MNEDEEILNSQVHMVSVKSGLRSDIVLYLLRQGWTYIQATGKPDQWVKRADYPKFTIRKEDLEVTQPYIIDAIRKEIIDTMMGKK